MEITTAKLTDAEAIAEVERRAWLETYPNQTYNISEIDVLERFENMSEQKDKVKANISRQSEHYFIARRKNQIVGYGHFAKSENQNHVVEIYVLQDSQGIGIGKELMKKGLCWFDNEMPVVLEVAEYNVKAKAFYRSLGFKEDTGLEQNTADKEWNVFPSGKVIPTVVMAKP